MGIRKAVSPPTPWSQTLARPQIDETAYVHVSTSIIGDVAIGANVMVAPGVSIRADEGSPFYIGDDTNIQDGVVVHGLADGRVKGDDGIDYSVWIGARTSITHKALIHGPAYVGDDCFIGFRSTVFNAKVGDGCVVMMHVLIENVEIPPGKYVPSGAIITNQQQADRLSDVMPEDEKFAHHIIGINDSLRSGYLCVEDGVCSIDNAAILNTEENIETITGIEDMSNISENIRQQIRRLLSQGYRIGAEFADTRRFRTGSWQSCTIAQGSESSVLTSIAGCLEEHQGKYVQLIGIDTNTRSRVLEMMIQRPDGAVTQVSHAGVSGSVPVAGGSSNASFNGGSGDIAQTVRQLLNQGFRIGTEYADARRYRATSWTSGPAYQGTREGEAIAMLNELVSANPDCYVRLIGIDPSARRRVTEVVIHKPGDGGTISAPASSGGGQVSSFSSSFSSGATANANVKTSLSSEVVASVRRLLENNYQISTEHADQRRFRSSSWHSCKPVTANRLQDAVAQLETCLSDHQGEYVRLIGIDTKAKRRVHEEIVQRP